MLILWCERRYYLCGQCSPAILDVETDRELGETKKDFKAEVALPSSLSLLICFQPGARDQCTSALSLKKYTLSTGQYRPIRVRVEFNQEMIFLIHCRNQDL